MLLCTAMLLSLTACQEDDVSLLGSDVSLVEFEHTGGSQTIKIESDADWSIYGLPDWLNVSVYSGINTQEVTLTSTANNTGLDREHELTIRSNDSKKALAIRILQHGDARGRLLQVDNINKKYFNGETSFDYEDSVVVNSSLQWTITGPSWLSARFNDRPTEMNGELRQGSGTLLLRVNSSYYAENEREDTIRIQSETGDILHKIPVVQLGGLDIVPVNMVVLTDVFFCNFKYGTFVKSFSYSVYNDEIVEAYRSYDLLNPRVENSISKKANATKTQYLAYQGLTPETYYNMYLVPRPGDAEDDQYYDTLYHKRFQTPSDIGQPRAIISNVYLKDGKWHYDVTMNQFAKGYYFSVLSGTFVGKSKAYIAYRLYNEIKAGNIKMHDTNAYAIQNRSDDVIFASWAIGADGKLSDMLDIYRASNTE